jgi:hypothetical protein
VPTAPTSYDPPVPPPNDAASPATYPSTSPRAALFIAHPGHELRVHGWLERVRPLVFVLTDGSGHTERGRLGSTTEVLQRAGARAGTIYGRLTDRRLYRALLDREVDLFASLADELAEALDREGIEIAAGDAAEGFNPGHDVCRLLLNAAVSRVAARGRTIPSYEFPLEAAPDAEVPGSLRLDLDDAALERKLAASRGYPEMAYEVDKALASFGVAAFRTEVLRPVDFAFDFAGRFPHPPYYESYGEKQVAKGVYGEVLRFRDHFEPLARELERTCGAPPA